MFIFSFQKTLMSETKVPISYEQVMLENVITNLQAN